MNHVHVLVFFSKSETTSLQLAIITKSCQLCDVTQWNVKYIGAYWQLVRSWKLICIAPWSPNIQFRGAWCRTSQLRSQYGEIKMFWGGF